MHSLRECRHIRLISTVGGGKRQWLSAAFWQRVLSSQINYDALTYQRQRTYFSLVSSSATPSSTSSPLSSLLTPKSAFLHHPATFSSSFSDSSKEQNDDSRKPISLSKLSATPSLSSIPFSLPPSLHVFQSRQSSGIPHSGSVPIEAPSSSPSTTSDSARQQKLVKGMRIRVTVY